MKFTDDEIIAALESEESLSVDSSTGELAQQRADALNRYRGALLGNEVEGRSQIVDRSVMDTIEWIMPSLMRIFLGGDEIGKFEAYGPEDEKAAEEETDVCNWYLESRNDIFNETCAALKDALLLKNGYMVGNWVCRYDTMTETYVGQTDDEFAMLMNDPEVTVVEHTEYQDALGQTLHDAKVEMKKCDEYVSTEATPPDELLVSRRHRRTSVLDADFVEWVRRNVTIGQLRAEGFDIPDDVPMDDTSTMEQSARDRFGQNPLERDDETKDPSRRVVTFRDAYMRIDLRGSGTPQLWRLARIDGMRQLVLKEEANIIPFAAFSPIIYPHSHVGISVYDLIADLGVIKTTLERQALDGIYLQNSGRLGVDINKLVNLDDLLVSRPGGIIRFDGPPQEALFPIVNPDSSPAVLGMLEFIEAQKEGRTGVTRYSAGLDSNTLNKTATGVQAIQAAANQRIELIARTLSGGFRDLFLIIHALASKHSTQALQIKLKGEWRSVDPRQWKKRTDFKISVGLGTGTPEQQLQKLQMMQPTVQMEMQMGLAGPMELYNYGQEMWKAAGYKIADRFIKPPQMQPQMEPVMGPNGPIPGPDGKPQMRPKVGPDGKPVMQPVSPPPQKDPIVQAEEVKGQVALQKAQMDQQGDQLREQARAQADAQKAAADSLFKRQQMEHDAQLERERMAQEAILKREEMQHQAALKKYEIDEKVRAEILLGQMRENLAHQRALQNPLNPA